MATAEQTGVMSLARMWWRAIFDDETVQALNEPIGIEIARQSTYLVKSWNADTQEVLVGVGDQVEQGELLMYSDFGTADRALSVRTSSEKTLLLL
jgi:hypothetical protein